MAYFDPPDKTQSVSGELIEKIKKLQACKVFVTAVEIECPVCFVPIPNPDGSLFWVMEELPKRVVGCPTCHKDYRLPMLGFMKR